MNPGQFNRRITIQSNVETKDDLGQIENSWQDSHLVWAMIKTVQGREYFEAASTQNENTVRFVIRYVKGINPHMRILYNDRVFEILSVINDDERNKTLTILTKEVGR
jgi:SPP1 family predicted phage head-tail adaptor